MTQPSKHGAEVSTGALPALGALEDFLGLEAAGLSPDSIVRAALRGEEGKAWRPRDHTPGWKAEWAAGVSRRKSWTASRGADLEGFLRRAKESEVTLAGRQRVESSNDS